jgi:hypothetical protein
MNLAVTVSDLRLGQGYVRCGRCTNVFNALLALSEGSEDGASPVTAPAPVVAPPEPAPEPAAAEPTASPPAPPAAIEISVDEVDPNEATGEVEVLRTGTYETIILEGEGVLQTQEIVAESEVDAQLQALVQRFDAVRELEEATAKSLWPADENTPEPEFDLDDSDETPASRQSLVAGLDYAELEPRPHAPAEGARMPKPIVIPFVEQTPDEEPPVARSETSHAADLASQRPGDFANESDDEPPGHRGRWIAGSAVLLLALAAQVAHHNRNTLVSVPWLTAPMTSLYGSFNVQLEPHWDLQAYEVRQLGAEAVPGETAHIAVRASIRNRAPRSQPPPLLRVVLQDRFGNQIATREVAPLEYLRGAAPPRLGTDQRVDADLLLPDPGQAAVGFEIDACLRNAAGVLRCASDPVPH